MWVRDHDPASFEKLRQVLLPKDYLRYCLTGEYASEVSDASGTAMFDVVGRKWSSVMVSGAGLDKSILPRVVESQEITGKVTAKAAALTGLAGGTPVVGGGGDQAASAVGNGIVREGIASCTIGTSGVVFVHVEKPVYDPGGRVHTFCHAVPGKWHVMGVTQGAGLSLQWMRNRLAPGVDYSELSKEAAESPAGSQGLFWLPYLMGERTPYLDAQARGGWIGLTAKHTRADMIRSVMEGVAYSQKDCLSLIEGLGAKVASVRLSGGGARSAFWKRILTDVFDRTVATLETQEGSAYGAALLGMVGTGAFASVEEACRESIQESERLEPDSGAAAAYRRSYEVFTELYPALKALFPKMNR
jgi:xylulokinase